MASPTPELAHELVALACLAPSIHNTQPWAWRVVDDTVELYADRRRQLTHTDPGGRALAVSCGAALHHLVVAAEGLGLTAHRSLLPTGGRDDLLARVRLERGKETPASLDALRALRSRRTDRRAFTDQTVPLPLLRALTRAASSWGGHVLPVTDHGLAATVDLLLQEARHDQSYDPDLAGEHASWIDHSSEDGVPLRHAFPRAPRWYPRRSDRFDLRPHGRRGRSREETGDVFVAVFTAHDGLGAWLAAGQTLSALWIRATQAGLSLTPESQVTEVDRTRRLLCRHLLDELQQPQVLVRVGWQPPLLPRQRSTPRRDLADVLLPEPRRPQAPVSVDRRRQDIGPPGR